MMMMTMMMVLQHRHHQQGVDLFLPSQEVKVACSQEVRRGRERQESTWMHVASETFLEA